LNRLDTLPARETVFDAVFNAGKPFIILCSEAWLLLKALVEEFMRRSFLIALFLLIALSAAPA
jgi:hypothetical protein